METTTHELLRAKIYNVQQSATTKMYSLGTGILFAYLNQRKSMTLDKSTAKKMVNGYKVWEAS